MPEPFEYDPSELQNISAAEQARERPGLYLGTTDFSESANCLARETFCLAIDEILNNNCSELSVGTVDEWFHLSHNGNCPDAKEVQRDGKTTFESILTTRWVCRKHADAEYVGSNICRLSIPTVVYLSKQFEIEGFDGQNHYFLRFENGESELGLQRLGESDNTGISLRFTPNKDVLGHTEFNIEELRLWFEKLPLPHDSLNVKWEIGG